MSKLLKQKWRTTAILGMFVALAGDWTAKWSAGAAMTALAKQTARIPTEANSKSLVHLSEMAECIGLVAALAAVVCWSISGYRHEPGTSFWLVLLTAIYGISLLLMV